MKVLLLVVFVSACLFLAQGQTCAPRTCKSVGIFCGNISDGCGKNVTCGPPCKTITTCNGQFFGQALTASDVPADGVPVIMVGIPIDGPLLSQLWIIYPHETLIRHAQNPQLILGYDTADNSSLRLINITRLVWNDARLFQWTLARNTTAQCGSYLVNLRRSEVLDAWNLADSQSTPVIRYTPKAVQNAANQLWEVKPGYKAGAYVFVSVQNGHALSINGTLKHNTAVVRAPLPIPGNPKSAYLRQQWHMDITKGLIISAQNTSFHLAYSYTKTAGIGQQIRVVDSSLITATDLSNYHFVIGHQMVNSSSMIFNPQPSAPVATVIPFNGVPLLTISPISTSSSLWQSKVVIRT